MYSTLSKALFVGIPTFLCYAGTYKKLDKQVPSNIQNISRALSVIGFVMGASSMVNMVACMVAFQKNIIFELASTKREKIVQVFVRTTVIFAYLLLCANAVMVTMILLPLGGKIFIGVITSLMALLLAFNAWGTLRAYKIIDKMQKKRLENIDEPGPSRSNDEPGPSNVEITRISSTTHRPGKEPMV